MNNVVSGSRAKTPRIINREGSEASSLKRVIPSLPGGDEITTVSALSTDKIQSNSKKVKSSSKNIMSISKAKGKITKDSYSKKQSSSAQKDTSDYLLAYPDYSNSYSCSDYSASYSSPQQHYNSIPLSSTNSRSTILPSSSDSTTITAKSYTFEEFGKLQGMFDGRMQKEIDFKESVINTLIGTVQGELTNAHQRSIMHHNESTLRISTQPQLQGYCSYPSMHHQHASNSNLNTSPNVLAGSIMQPTMMMPGYMSSMQPMMMYGGMQPGMMMSGGMQPCNMMSTSCMPAPKSDLSPTTGGTGGV